MLSYISKLKAKEIKQAFIVGSFLKDADYRDIDILLVSESKTEEEVYEKLTEKFGLKFHVISIPDERFKTLIEICPLTRNMLFSYASNKKFKLPEKKIDKEHINFLLMMPEDLLKIKAGGRVFYDIIRRLVTIENFLEKENPEKINSELKKILGNLFDILRKDDKINEEIIKKLRKIIKSKLNIIKKKIN